MSARFSCVTLVMVGFSLDLLRAVISYWTKSHLKSNQKSTMELFWENSQRAKDSGYFRKTALLHMF